ncbi:acyl-CoA dehydrogenase family member 11-like isoform X1 [Styela clava]
MSKFLKSFHNVNWIGIRRISIYEGRNGQRTASVNPSAQNDKKVTNDHCEAFRHAKIGNFFQDQPVLHNPYTTDTLLKSFLKKNIPENHFKVIEDDLIRFGDRICTEIHEKGLECERNPPTLTQYDAWGRRIDQLNTCDAWKSMKTVSAEEGMIAIGYERNYGEYSRLYQMAKLFLFGASSGLYSCPLAMTDGAAKVLESSINDVANNDGVFGNAYRRLTSRNPDLFWTSGQWMTERGGGSDVANGTETVACRQSDGTFTLHGYKWFSSATDADIAFTLARIIDENGDIKQGSKGLSLFFLETRNPKDKKLDSGLNGIQMQRLKNKLGTRQLPTAELLLDGTVAHQIGDESHGVRHISDMLTITRIYNCLMGISGMKRLLQLAVDYSCRRTAFGSKLCDNTLHVQTLARIDIETRAAFLMTFEIIRLLGLEEAGIATNQDLALIRILTPVCKLYTAKQALDVSTEGLECFGGMGYLEDSGLPRHLRDAQVLSIWEGTTNILSMDVLRAIEKSDGKVLTDFFSRVEKIVNSVKNSEKSYLSEPIKNVESAIKDLSAFVLGMQKKADQSEIVVAARDMSYSISKIFMAALLLEHAIWERSDKTDIYAAKRWCSQDLCPVMTNYKSGFYDKDSSDVEKLLVYASYPENI